MRAIGPRFEATIARPDPALPVDGIAPAQIGAGFGKDASVVAATVAAERADARARRIGRTIARLEPAP